MRMGCYDPNKHKAEDIEKANFMISDLMGGDSEQMFVTGILNRVYIEILRRSRTQML